MTPHAFLGIHSGYVFFRVTDARGYKTEGSEPFAIGNTRNHKCAEDAVNRITGMLKDRGITSVEIHDYR